MKTIDIDCCDAGLPLSRSPRRAAARAQAHEYGAPELIAAAKKEGRLVYYTANFAEVEQEVIKAFNKRFPEIKVEMVRAPGGQLITRIKTEAAAGKLLADLVNHSDRGLMLEIENLFMDYAPPNAKDYLRMCWRRRNSGRRRHWAGRSPTTRRS